MKVLMLTMSASRKKNAADNALKSLMEKSTPDCFIETVDVLKYINLLLDKLIKDGYIIELRKNFLINDRQDDSTNNEGPTDVTVMFYDFIAQKLESMVSQTCPDVIVSTHPFHLKIMEILRLKDKISIPLIALVTEFSIGQTWNHNIIDTYIISHENLKHELIDRGAPEEKIFTLKASEGTDLKDAIVRVTIGHPQ